MKRLESTHDKAIPDLDPLLEWDALPLVLSYMCALYGGIELGPGRVLACAEGLLGVWDDRGLRGVVALDGGGGRAEGGHGCQYVMMVRGMLSVVCCIYVVVVLCYMLTVKWRRSFRDLGLSSR
jgi:hypothetical protein